MRRSSRNAPASAKAPGVQETTAAQEEAEVSLVRDPEAKKPEAKAEKGSVIGKKKLVTLVTPYQKVHPKTGTRFFPNDAVPHEVDAWILAMKDAKCFTISDLPSE